MIRDAYRDAATLFVDLVGHIESSQWERPALGEWSVRDLVGHTSRALLTVENYLASPATERQILHPADYFRRAQAGLADAAAVAARGRAAGAALGSDPAAAVRDLATRVLTRLETAADEVLVSTPVGGMRLIDYLPSRVFELGVHSLDLAAALPATVTLPATVASVALHLLADLAVPPTTAAALLLAATGRGALPAGFSVL